MTNEEAKIKLDKLFAESTDLLTKLHDAGHDDLINRMLDSWDELKKDLAKTSGEE